MNDYNTLHFYDNNKVYGVIYLIIYKLFTISKYKYILYFRVIKIIQIYKINIINSELIYSLKNDIIQICTGKINELNINIV